MPAEIVFSGGERVEVPDGDASLLVQQLTRSRVGQADQVPPPGWHEVNTKDGPIYVNAAQVA